MKGLICLKNTLVIYGTSHQPKKEEIDLVKDSFMHIN